MVEAASNLGVALMVEGPMEEVGLLVVDLEEVVSPSYLVVEPLVVEQNLEEDPLVVEPFPLVVPRVQVVVPSVVPSALLSE